MRGVPPLGGLLGGAPPGLVLAVPGDGLGEAGREVGVGRLPAELAAELGRVDRVAAVVGGAVAHPVEVVPVTAENVESPYTPHEIPWPLEPGSFATLTLQSPILRFAILVKFIHICIRINRRQGLYANRRHCRHILETSFRLCIEQ